MHLQPSRVDHPAARQQPFPDKGSDRGDKAAEHEHRLGPAEAADVPDGLQDLLLEHRPDDGSGRQVGEVTVRPVLQTQAAVLLLGQGVEGEALPAADPKQDRGGAADLIYYYN